MVNRYLDLLGISEVDGAPCPPLEFRYVVVVPVVLELGRMELRQWLEAFKQFLRPLEVGNEGCVSLAELGYL